MKSNDLLGQSGSGLKSGDLLGRSGNGLKSGDLLGQNGSGLKSGDLLGHSGNGLGTVKFDSVNISNQYEEEESSDLYSEEGVSSCAHCSQ